MKRLLSMVTAAAVCMTALCMPVSAADYNDMEYITSHVQLAQTQKLTITRPAKDISTTDSAYFVMGTSTAGVPITVNGKAVTAVGARGSFGAYLNLSPGANLFTFSQNGQTASVTITRSNTATVATTNSITSMFPTYDVAVPGGKQTTISCTAPSGAAVTAYINGVAVPMKQVAATAVKGVAAKFQATISPSAVSKTTSRGNITYVMQYNGQQKSFTSAGKLFIAGSTLLVQTKNNAACIYDDSRGSNYLMEARKGSIEKVVDFGANSYKLSFGGWIPRESVDILADYADSGNSVSSAQLQSYMGGEALVLAGTSHPFYDVTIKDNVLTLKLMRTQMNSAGIDMSASRLFSSASVTQGSSAAQITLPISNPALYWGYDVRYANGVTTVYFKYKPSVGGSAPLSGLTVALDAGHGGDDPGALGIAWTSGPTEADLNLATAIAVQKRLEGLGANVILTRSSDQTMSMNDRMDISAQKDADIFISLHANSIGYTANAAKATGTEVYYYYNGSKNLASHMNAYVAQYNGRTARGAKHSNYRVTIQSYCPSVLVETGFMCNPAEYDTLTSKTGIFRTANAIGDGLIKLFQ